MVNSDISETSTLAGAQDTSEPEPVPFEICGAPTNYLRVFRGTYGSEEAPILGQYLIDLSLPPVPQSLPHAVSATENLFLRTSRGPVTADVWLTGNNQLRLVSLKLTTCHGSICAKVHNAFSGSDGGRRPSLDIDLWADHGGVSLSLPHCFHGLMTIKCSHQYINFSPAFKKRTALLSEDKNVCVYFVGDRPRSWTKGAGAGRHPEEQLDELSVGGLYVGKQSGVRIRSDGEPELPS